MKLTRCWFRRLDHPSVTMDMYSSSSRRLVRRPWRRECSASSWLVPRTRPLGILGAYAGRRSRIMSLKASESAMLKGMEVR